MLERERQSALKRKKSAGVAEVFLGSWEKWDIGVVSRATYFWDCEIDAFLHLCEKPAWKCQTLQGKLQVLR